MLPKQMCRQAVNGTDVPLHFILLPVISRLAHQGLWSACYLHIECRGSSARLQALAHALNKSPTTPAALSIGSRQWLLNGVIRVGRTRPTRACV